MSEACRFIVHLDDLASGPLSGSVADEFGHGVLVGQCAVANGCFDLLHPGHLSLLATLSYRAYLRRLQPVVALNSDVSVRALKGPSRPVVNEWARAELLASLRWPFSVVIFDEETPQRLMDLLQPAIVVKGADRDPETVVRWRESEVVLVPMLSDWSTTGVLGESVEEGPGHR